MWCERRRDRLRVISTPFGAPEWVCQIDFSRFDCPTDRVGGQRGPQKLGHAGKVLRRTDENVVAVGALEKVLGTFDVNDFEGFFAATLPRSERFVAWGEFGNDCDLVTNGEARRTDRANGLGRDKLAVTKL